MAEIDEQLYKELIDKIKTYHPSDDFSMVEKAYKLAVEAHKEQKRKSGEPYIIHPLKVAYILAELELDMETITAGILHDIIEDTPYTYEDITHLFGEDIAVLVDGVTKLGKLSYTTKEEAQAENYRKMFLAMPALLPHFSAPCSIFRSLCPLYISSGQRYRIRLYGAFPMYESAPQTPAHAGQSAYCAATDTYSASA